MGAALCSGGAWCPSSRTQLGGPLEELHGNVPLMSGGAAAAAADDDDGTRARKRQATVNKRRAAPEDDEEDLVDDDDDDDDDDDNAGEAWRLIPRAHLYGPIRHTIGPDVTPMRP